MATRLILSTKYGGVPYLNDSLISKLNFEFFNFKFSEFVNNLDVFDSMRNNILRDFFHLGEQTFVSLFDPKDSSVDLGSNEDESIFIVSTNGKTKLDFLTYIKYVNKLNPKHAIIPYEHISKSCGKKKHKRNIEKYSNFIKTIKLVNNPLPSSKQTSYFIPVFLNNELQENFLEELSCKHEKNIIDGYTLFLDDYRTIDDLEKTIERVQSMVERLGKGTDGCKFSLFGDGNPGALLLFSLFASRCATQAGFHRGVLCV